MLRTRLWVTGLFIWNLGFSSSSSSIIQNTYFSPPALKTLVKSPGLILLPNARGGYQQKEDYTCAPASAMTLLNMFGQLSDQQMTHATELKISKEMQANEHSGTTAQNLANWLYRHDYAVEEGVEGSLSLLQKKLKEGKAIFLEWIDWGGHWSLLVGYDTMGTPTDEDDVLILADPSDYGDGRADGITFYSAYRFKYMWFGYQSLTEKKPKGVWLAVLPKASKAPSKP